jgi:hypothetical protein
MSHLTSTLKTNLGLQVFLLLFVTSLATAAACWVCLRSPAPMLGMLAGFGAGVAVVIVARPAISTIRLHSKLALAGGARSVVADMVAFLRLHRDELGRSIRDDVEAQCRRLEAVAET